MPLRGILLILTSTIFLASSDAMSKYLSHDLPSLEIAWTRIVADREIAGARVVPFHSEGAEGFSIDYPDDWELAERMAAEDPALLAPVSADG